MEINDSLINIFITCFVTIFYISRKILNRNKKSKYTEEIISKINELDIGKFTIDNLLNEIKNILKPDDIKINILSNDINNE
jgi:hypothetical protein